MDSCRIVKIREHPEWRDRAAAWFHEKWGVPLEAYLESMDECVRATAAVPRWYAAVSAGRIVGGLGVIENDFHERRDLTPNVCALYVEQDCRRRGLAGRLLERACRDMEGEGVARLYLVTEHTSFYERYGWRYLCMAREEGGEGMLRVYVHGAGRGLSPGEE